MFIERLSNQQVRNFAKELISLTGRNNSEFLETSVDRLGPAHDRVYIFHKSEEDFSMCFNLYDFEVICFDSGIFTPNTISQKYFQFMYCIFGEEYKTAYLENAAKIFDEVTTTEEP